MQRHVFVLSTCRALRPLCGSQQEKEKAITDLLAEARAPILEEAANVRRGMTQERPLTKHFIALQKATKAAKTGKMTVPQLLAHVETRKGDILGLPSPPRTWMTQADDESLTLVCTSRNKQHN